MPGFLFQASVRKPKIDLRGTNNDGQPGVSRRGLLAALAAAPVLTATPTAAQTAAAQAQAALKDAKGTKLVLLGTAAGPVPGRTRQMTSHVMLNNSAAYVLDCGLGVTDQFARTGIPFSALRSIFITHRHADHNVEYGPLLVVGWIQGLPLNIRAFGSSPLKQMTDDIMRAYKTTMTKRGGNQRPGSLKVKSSSQRI